MSDSESISTAFDALETALTPYASNPPPHFWIGGADVGENFCRPCVEEKLADARADEPAREVWIDGGWEAHSEDSPAYCAGCGRLTSYAPTDYLVLDQVTDHVEFPSSPTRMVPMGAVYEVLRLVQYVDQTSDLAPDVLAIGHETLRICRLHDPYVWRDDWVAA